MKCELNCHDCSPEVKRNCAFWQLDAHDVGAGKTLSTTEHSHTRSQLRTKIDAKAAAKNIKGTSGGTYGGVPTAIELSPELYTTDQLKSEFNSKGGKK